MSHLFVIGAFALVLGFLVASAYALYWWRGFWRLLALAPVVVMAFVVIRIVIQPEAHNLWPFEIVLWSGGCLLALAALSWAAGSMVPRTERGSPTKGISDPLRQALRRR